MVSGKALAYTLNLAAIVIIPLTALWFIADKFDPIYLIYIVAYK